MTDRTETDVQVVGSPSYLAAHAGKQSDAMQEAMKEYRVLTRLRVVQSQSSNEELKEQHGVGGVVLQPGAIHVSDKGAPFLFVPLYFFTEFAQWSDRRDKGSNAVVARSFDKAGHIAQCARDKTRRFEEYEGGPADKPFKYRFVEHLVFPGLIYGDHELAGTPCTLSFERGEFAKGRALWTAIGMRKVPGEDGGMEQAPIWSTVWEFHTAQRSNSEGSWYGFDQRNPAEPWIKEHEVEPFLAMHEELAKLHEENRLSVDRTDADEDQGSTDPDDDNDEDFG